MSSVRILGIGSPSGDDQAGWLTIDALRALGVQSGDGLTVDTLDRPGARLVGLLEDADRVILVDAMQSDSPPGRIARFDQKDWTQYGQGLSSHGFGVLAALSLAQALGSQPARLDLYGIEIASAAPGDEARPEVQAAARQLAAIIAASLGE